MIDRIYVTKNISMHEATYLKGATSICDPHRHSWYVQRGLLTPSIGLSKSSNGYTYTATLTFPVIPSAFPDKRFRIDTKRLISVLDSINELKKLSNPWLLSSIRFEKKITNIYSEEYISLLYKGHKMKSISMKRTVDDPCSPRILEYKSKGAYLRISAEKYRLNFNLLVRKERLKECLKSRNLSDTRIYFKKLEKEMWTYYLGKLSGPGDYMTFNYAEDQIYKLDCTRKLKERYIHLLRCVQYYKGLDNFLSKVTDPNFAEISYFHNMATVNRDIRELGKAGINPVTISRRAAGNINVFPNIISVLKL